MGIVDSLPLIEPLFAACGAAEGSAASFVSQRLPTGPALRRGLTVGSAGAASQPKSNKLRDTLYSLMAVTIAMEPAGETALLQGLVPHLVDALPPQQRSDSVASPPPARVLLTLLVYEGRHGERIAEIVQQRQRPQGPQSVGPQSADSLLTCLLLPADSLKHLLRTRQEIRPLHASALEVSSFQSAQTEAAHQPAQGHSHEEAIRLATPRLPDPPAGAAGAATGAAPLSTRSQRMQRSSAAAFIGGRRQQGHLKDELHNELKGRLEPSLLSLMFPLSGSSPQAAGSRQGAPQLPQLKAACDIWKNLFCTDTKPSTAQQQQQIITPPLRGEHSITDLLLKWIAFW